MIDIAAAGPRSNWPSGDLDEVDRQEGRRVAGPAAGEHQQLGVDHEASMKRSRMAMVSTRFIFGSWM